MKTKKNSIILATILMSLLTITWLTTTLQGDATDNTIRQEYSVPMQQTDASRAIDAYERMMERYMNINEQTMAAMSAEIAETSRKLDLVLAKMENIERALKIEKTLINVTDKAIPAANPVPSVPPVPTLETNVKPEPAVIQRKF